jgi:hypothetical protein
MRTRALSTVTVFLLLLCSAAAASSATTWQLTAACGFSGVGGDLLDRGFYITNYPGSNLSQVELGYTASTGASGLWSISLTARRGAYNGQIIGSAQILTPTVPDQSSASEVLAVFDFGGAPVTPGDTITFTQTAERLSGSGGSLFFDVGTGSCSNIIETDGTVPPLDDGPTTPRRHTIGIVATQHAPTTSCIASDTVMCVDNNPGDQRFQVTVTFHHSGGISGNGQEIPLAQLGVVHGGLFWFFGPDNPEMLFKMINGCALNSRFWVFISAGTNVAFTVNVFDTATGHTATYNNPDNTAAFPVQDTNALTCP